MNFTQASRGAVQRYSEHDGIMLRGMGFSQHSGVVIVADGTPEAAKRLERVLWNDPASGVMRHADAGYDIALDCAKEKGLRLPGIVARPPAPSGLISAFMSEVMWAAVDHRPVRVPVSAEGVCWWMSVKAAVDALLHAAALPGQGRIWLPPVLRLTMGELVAALTDRFGPFAVTYAPDPAVEAKFARQPPLIATAARAAGFRDDGDVVGLIKAAVG